MDLKEFFRQVLFGLPKAAAKTVGSMVAPGIWPWIEPATEPVFDALAKRLGVEDVRDSPEAAQRALEEFERDPRLQALWRENLRRKFEVHDLQIRAVEMLRTGQEEQAAAELRAAALLLQAMLQQAPEDVGLIIQLGYLHKTRAQILQETGKAAEAERSLGDALDAFKAAAGREFKDAKTKNDLSNAVNGVGNTQHLRGEYEAAIDSYRVAAALNPSNPYTWHDMFASYVELAKQGKVDRAGMRKAFDSMKAVCAGHRGFDEQYLKRLEGVLRSYDGA